MTQYIIGIEKYRRRETGREICEKAEIYRSGIQDLFIAASFDRISPSIRDINKRMSA